MKLVNKVICPETLLRVLLPAGEIPDQARVSKRTGDAVYTLRQRLRVFPKEKTMETIELEGVFLVNDRGDINQAKEDTLLHWHVAAEDFMQTISHSWEENK